MRTIIVGSLTPLNSSRTMRGVRWSDDHSRKTVHNVLEASSAAGAYTSPAAPIIRTTRWSRNKRGSSPWTIVEQPERIRVLIRDHDKFTWSFDEVFRGAGIRIVRTPIQAPQANAIAERFVPTVRAECLDWLLIMDVGHRDRVLHIFIDHYDRGYPHANLGPGIPEPPTLTVSRSTGQHIARGHGVAAKPILGGFHHEYRLEPLAP